MPPEFKTRYRIELLCDYPEWWRYNVYIMAVGFDQNGGLGTFNNLVDKVYDVNFNTQTRSRPADYKSPRIIELTTQECAFVEIYVYVVTNTFPTSEVIGDSPSFTATLRVSANNMVLDQTPYTVNQWGGLTIVAHHVDIHKP